MALLRKLVETYRFLRYGPTRLQSALDHGAQLDQQLAELHDLGRQREAQVSGQFVAAYDLLRRQEAYAAAHLAELRHQAAALEQALAARTEDSRREAEWTRNQLNGLLAALDRLQPASAGPAGAAPAAGVAAAEETFYPTLERYFRGSPEDVRGRLAAYRPWMEGLPDGPVADLGCGRGEWLELLRDWGISARGVDLNALNVQELRSRGLDVEQGDLLQWLGAQADASFAALSSFHVIEHLPFGVLLRMMQEARRVLRPGGRLILETPNPENVIVATQTFWLDPSHVRPLPPALLELVVRDAGLQLDALLRLNPPPEEHDVVDATLRALMTQGRDCAVVARKPTVSAA